MTPDFIRTHEALIVCGPTACGLGVLLVMAYVPPALRRYEQRIALNMRRPPPDVRWRSSGDWEAVCGKVSAEGSTPKQAERALAKKLRKVFYVTGLPYPEVRP